MREAFSAIMEGFSILLRYRRELVKKLLFPLAFLCGLIILGEVFTLGSIMQWGIVCLAFVDFAVIAVTVHRAIILGTGSIPEWGIWPLSMREIRFALYQVGFLAAFSGANALFMYPLLKLRQAFDVGGIWTTVMMVAVVWTVLFCLAMRFFLVFPGTAVDESPELRGSWALTRNRKVFLFITVGVFPQLLLGVAGLVQQLPGIGYLWFLTYLLVYVMIVAVLSVVYTRICGQPGSGCPIQIEL